MRLAPTRTFFLAALIGVLAEPIAHSETAWVGRQGLKLCRWTPQSEANCVRLRPGTEIDLTGSARRVASGETFFELETADGAAKGWISALEVKSSLVVEDPSGISNEREGEACNGEPRVGMSEQEILKTCWGKPRSRRRVGVEGLMRDQWVYGEGRYLYFANGELIAIQE